MTDSSILPEKRARPYPPGVEVPETAAVLLAAGESSRMGQPKSLLWWRGLRLVQYQTASLLESGVSSVIVILGHNSDDIVPHIVASDIIQIVINPDHQKGKTTSIRLGMSHVSNDVNGILLLAVDQPRPPDLVRHVMEEHQRSGAIITHPTHGGRGGHPIIFDISLKRELLSITEENQGIREVVARHHGDTHTVAVDTSIARVDLNTMDDYVKAFREFGAVP